MQRHLIGFFYRPAGVLVQSQNPNESRTESDHLQYPGYFLSGKAITGPRKLRQLPGRVIYVRSLKNPAYPPNVSDAYSQDCKYGSIITYEKLNNRQART